MKQRRWWVWAGVALLVLAVAAGMGAWLHRNPSWGQDVESAAAVAAALLTAMTAVFAAVSASESRDAGAAARRALTLLAKPTCSLTAMGPPEFEATRPNNNSEEPVPAYLSIAVRPAPVKGSITWVTSNRVSHQQVLAGTERQHIALPGVTYITRNNVTVGLAEVVVVFTDASGAQWRARETARDEQLGTWGAFGPVDLQLLD